MLLITAGFRRSAFVGRPLLTQWWRRSGRIANGKVSCRRITTLAPLRTRNGGYRSTRGVATGRNETAEPRRSLRGPKEQLQVNQINSKHVFKLFETLLIKQILQRFFESCRGWRPERHLGTRTFATPQQESVEETAPEK